MDLFTLFEAVIFQNSDFMKKVNLIFPIAVDFLFTNLVKFINRNSGEDFKNNASQKYW